MNVFFLFTVSALAALGGKIFAKLCSNTVANGSVAQYTLFLTVNGAVACLFFWISGGFCIALNLATLLYSLAYAAVIAVILISGLMIYKFATIAGVNILSSAFGLLGSLAAGALLFDEHLGPRAFARVGIMLLAALLVFLDTKKQEAPRKEALPTVSARYTLTKIAVLAALLLSGLANTIITKSFALSEQVTDDNSFFFMTNALIVLGAILVFAIECLKDPDEFHDALRLLRPRRLISMAGNTVCSNVGSLVGLRLMALMAVSVYSPISSAVGMLLAVISSWIFREKLGLLSYLAAAIACVAVFI